MKTCIKCGQLLDFSEFPKRKDSKDGLRSEYKKCKKERDSAHHLKNKTERNLKTKQYYQQHKDEHRIKIKLNYLENRDLRLQQMKEYRKVNFDVLSEKEKEYKLKNKEWYLDYCKQYYKDNKDLMKLKMKIWHQAHLAEHRQYNRKRRALKVQVNEHYTKIDERYTRDLFDNRCYNCGSSDDLHIDHHYPLCDGNPLTRVNAVALCKACNCSKGGKLPDDWYTPSQLDVLTKLLTKGY